MKKIIPIIIAALTLAGGAKAQTKVTVFDSGNGTTPYYRIPAILNQNGTLWAFTDDRSNLSTTATWGDIGSGEISIIAKTSSDNGATWSSSTKTVAAGSSSSSGFDRAHGDAAVVCDREDPNKMLVMCASGEVPYNTANGVTGSTVSVTRTGNRNNYKYSLNLDKAIRVGKYTSTNGGATWSGSDVTSNIYSIWDEANSTTYSSGVTVKKLFFSSGRICQSSIIKKGDYYRLYAALCTDVGVGSLVVYSDDFGDTWSALGGTSARPVSKGDEAKIEELPNGNVLISSRKSGGRYFNIYTYTNQSTAAGSWGSYSTSDSSYDGTYAYNNSTNGEVILVPAMAKDSNVPVYIALQSVPYGDSQNKIDQNTYKRSNVSIYWKVLKSTSDLDAPSDFTNGWTRYEVSSTTSAYSSMVLDNNGDIAFIYEENAINTTLPIGSTSSSDGNMDYYDIQFKSLPLSTITGGAYTYTTAKDVATHRTAFLNNTTIDDSGETTDTKSIDYWLGKVFTLKSLLAYPSTSSNYSTTVQRYIHSTYDSDGKLQLEAKKVDEVSSFDYTYYWTLSKDPNGEYYYLSCLNGDSYMGQEPGVSKDGDIVSYGNATCTDNYKTEFQVLDFVTSWGFDSGHEAKAKTLSSGVAFKFYVQYSGEDKELRVLSLNENGKFGWTKHTQTGELDGSPETYFSTEFILTEVTKGNINSYGTLTSPTHFGFPVKMTRSDNDKGDTNYEGYYYYATLKLPFAVNLTSAVDEDGTPYTVEVLRCKTPKDKPGDEVELEDITTLKDNTLPRETPVILRMGTKEKPAYDAAQITLYFQPTLAQDIITSTGLKGSLGRKTFTDAEYNPKDNANFFILGKKPDGRVKFYYLSDQKLAANKAYYVYNGTASSKSIVFRFADDDISTGITLPEVIEANDNAVIYDLSGRRVSSAVKKGIYIRDGKKFIVK